MIVSIRPDPFYPVAKAIVVIRVDMTYKLYMKVQKCKYHQYTIRRISDTDESKVSYESEVKYSIRFKRIGLQVIYKRLAITISSCRILPIR